MKFMKIFKNKKGFSLVEILAVIVILGIIAGIAGTSYLGYKNSLLQTEYENLVSLIEINAEKYANDYNLNAVNVQTLIELGYISSDDGIIYSPIDNEIMNCYVVEVNVSDGNYDAVLSVNVGGEPSNCNDYESNYNFGIDISSNDVIVFDNDNNIWLSGSNVVLSPLIPDDLTYLSDTATYSWSDANGGATSTDEYYYINKTGNYIAEHYLVMYYQVSEDSDYSILRTSKVIRIDNQAPTITVNILNNNIWTYEKTITVSSTDSGGSGVDKTLFYKCNNSTCTNPTNEVLMSTDSVIVDESGYYKFVVTDKVGNKIEEIFEVKYIDTFVPEISINAEDLIIRQGDVVDLNDYFDVTWGDSGGSFSCDPEDTSKISVGTTTITCSAVSGAGLSSDTATKNIRVKSLVSFSFSASSYSKVTISSLSKDTTDTLKYASGIQTEDYFLSSGTTLTTSSSSVSFSSSSNYYTVAVVDEFDEVVMIKYIYSHNFSESEDQSRSASVTLNSNVSSIVSSKINTGTATASISSGKLNITAKSGSYSDREVDYYKCSNSSATLIGSKCYTYTTVNEPYTVSGSCFIEESGSYSCTGKGCNDSSYSNQSFITYTCNDSGAKPGDTFSCTNYCYGDRTYTSSTSATVYYNYYYEYTVIIELK